MEEQKRGAIIFRDASISKEDNLIITDLNLQINSGDFAYLIGRVGSGKTSIIKTIIGEFPLKEGFGEVAGFSLNSLKEREIPLLRRRLGVVFQDFQLLSDRSVYDNLLFVLMATGLKNRSVARQKIFEKLESVDMARKSHKMPFELSGGEQQRVCIARALLNEPEIILADEPTGNLDTQSTEEIMQLFMQIHSEYKPAILFVTHNKALYKKFPGRVLLCEDMSCTEIEHSYEIELFDII